MHANRFTRLSILSAIALLLAACNLGGGGQNGTDLQAVPSPTLITPVTLPPTEPPPPTEVPVTPTLEVTPTPEVPPTPTPTTTPERPGAHQVTKGEWVYAIARVYGVNPKDIIAANPNIQANPNLIYPNQQLVIPGQTSAAVPAVPTAIPVIPPTAGAPSLPLVDSSVYDTLLNEQLPPLQGGTCATATASTFEQTWGMANVAPRLGCPTGEASAISGTWMEFGPGSRIIWLRELAQFHAITGNGFGQRWVFADNSGLAGAPPQVGPGGNQGYTPTEGRYAWLLQTHPEMASVFSPAFGDENVITGEYQPFEHGAILYDGALKLVFFDDAGPWWVLPQAQEEQPAAETQEAPQQ